MFLSAFSAVFQCIYCFFDLGLSLLLIVFFLYDYIRVWYSFRSVISSWHLWEVFSSNCFPYSVIIPHHMPSHDISCLDMLVLSFLVICGCCYGGEWKFSLHLFMLQVNDLHQNDTHKKTVHITMRANTFVYGTSLCIFPSEVTSRQLHVA